MSNALSEDITSDFVNELKDYIPLMREKIDLLNEQGIAATDIVLAELHRLIHAVRGASALLKLNNLSEVASELEAVVERMISGHLTFDNTVFKTSVDAIDYFAAYAQQIPCSDTYGLDMRAECLKSLGDLLDHASSDDEQDFLSQLIKAAHEDENLDFDTLAEEFSEPLDSPKMDANGIGGPAPEPFDLDQQELLEDFYQEAEDHFHDLGKVIGELEGHITTPTTMKAEEKELLRLIRRSVHTIKGAAAVIKLKPIANWGHEFENILDWLYEDAEVLAPEAVKVIADAADVLEQLVTDPQKTGPDRRAQLRAAFKQIVGSDNGQEISAVDQAFSEPSGRSAECVEVILPEEDCTDFPSPIQTAKRPIRVDFEKVKSLVNLCGELTIALSAFDQDIDGLGVLIEEIDQTQSRLKKTARDLELGYEHKAIGKLDAYTTMMEGAPVSVCEVAPAYAEFDPMELDQYSELNLIIRSLSETAADTGTISQQLAKTYIGFKGYLHKLRILLGELNEKAMRMRMTPMSTIANRLRRTVRETASQLNKKVHLTICGENIELDKMVWDKLADPLMHLLRNAVDHGIEPREIRQAAGKPDIASIQLTAAQKGNRVILRISDDGGGIDYGTIREAIVLPESEDKEAISQEELADMIFQPGFSTRQAISEVSGRGVGLDVVKETITDLKGTVYVERSENTGTTFCINLPLTMAISKALIFEICGERYATPLHDIKEVLRVNPKDLVPQGDNTIYISGRRLQYYKLTEVLQGIGLSTPSEETNLWPLILIVEKKSWKAAVAIDRIHSQRDIVLKSLGTHLSYVKGISGATIMGDGKVVPIIDLEDLLNLQIEPQQLTFHFIQPEEIEKPLNILIVDDSVTIRNVVSRLMKRQGWNVLTAKDGVDAIEVIHTQLPDVIILDIEMPRMNGYEFLSQIRNQEKFAELPVIMHSSRASKKHRKKAAKLGANDFVTKPYEEEDLITKIKDLSRLN